MSITELQELRHFAELGRLSASMIHEISNPLSAALLHLELSQYDSQAIKHAKRDMQVLRKYIDHARHYIQGRADRAIDNFNIQTQLNHLRFIFEPLATEKNIDLIFVGLSKKHTMRGDPIKFQNVLSNLISNSIQACGTDGRTIAVTSHINQNDLTISVKDDGPGISKTASLRIFDTFYSTKSDGGNMGLGLAIVKKYVYEDFGGSISFNNLNTRGTEFIITLPLDFVPLSEKQLKLDLV